MSFCSNAGLYVVVREDLLLLAACLMDAGFFFPTVKNNRVCGCMGRTGSRAT